MVGGLIDSAAIQPFPQTWTICSSAAARSWTVPERTACAPTSPSDIKTHSDFTLPYTPRAESKILQGVTTEVIGHCGFSLAPVVPGRVRILQE
jgi:hypothetical protein